MRAGTLRERITIQAMVPTTDVEWGPGESAQDVVTVSASVIAQGGGEAVKDSGVQATTHYAIEIRYRDGIDSTNRIIWKGKTLEVVSAIDPEGRKRRLVIDAIEHTQNG